MMGPTMFGPYGGGMWMFFHSFLWILVVIGIVLLIVWIVKQTGKGEHSNVEESALDILKKRYARGEVSKEEYEMKKKDIS